MSEDEVEEYPLEFTISQERLDLIGHDLLMIGQQHRLSPPELCIVLKLMEEWLEGRLGLTVAPQPQGEKK